jgi:hypothetical protein
MGPPVARYHRAMRYHLALAAAGMSLLLGCAEQAAEPLGIPDVGRTPARDRGLAPPTADAAEGADARTPDARADAGPLDARTPRDAAITDDAAPAGDAAPPADARPAVDAALVDACAAVDCSHLSTACAVGACDPALGHCVRRPRAEGDPCDDGDPCTTGGVCRDGACLEAEPMDCSGLDGPCVAGTCDAEIGGCVARPAAQGQPCPSDDACVIDPVCADGVCRGAPLDCGHLDATCLVGVCDPTAGACVARPAADGVACDDGQPCTVGTTCLDGACGEGEARDCSALTAGCRVGRCDAEAGCVADTLDDGADCDDGDACTVGETCEDGVCAGAEPVVCGDLDGPCAEGACDPATGACVARPVRSGEVCGPSDDPCLAPTCADGVCGEPGPVDCGRLDGPCVTGVCTPGVGCEALPVAMCSLCRGQAGLCDADGACLPFGPAAAVSEGFEGGALPAGWVTGGDRPWRAVDERAAEGDWAARSGDIGDSDDSTLTLQQATPDGGLLRFRYAVSSEAGFDFLRVRVDGAVVLEAAGEVDWTPFEVELAPGDHTIIFGFSKDLSIGRGQDAAWIDQVEVELGCPQTDCREGRRLDLDTCLMCPRADGTACAGGPCTAGTCVDGACAEQPANACGDCGPGLSRCVEGACGDFNTLYADFAPGGLPAPFVGAADRPWTTTADPRREGAGAAASGGIDHNQASVLAAPIELAEPGVVSFWYRTSTEDGYDHLRFFVDAQQQLEASGSVDWTFFELPLPAGQHGLEWRYQKDGSVDRGDDRVWIDEVAVGTPPVCE